jgi:hypothetical protein
MRRIEGMTLTHTVHIAAEVRKKVGNYELPQSREG